MKVKRQMRAVTVEVVGVDEASSVSVNIVSPGWSFPCLCLFPAPVKLTTVALTDHIPYPRVKTHNGKDHPVQWGPNSVVTRHSFSCPGCSDC